MLYDNRRERRRKRFRSAVRIGMAVVSCLSLVVAVGIVRATQLVTDLPLYAWAVAGLCGTVGVIGFLIACLI